MEGSGAPSAKQQRFAVIVLTLVLVVPLLAAVGLMAFGLLRTVPPAQALEFLLLIGPGACVFVVGLVLSFASIKRPERRLLALRLQVSGTTLALLLPDMWLAWNAATGGISPAAWLGVTVLTSFVAMRLVVLRNLSVATPAGAAKAP